MTTVELTVMLDEDIAEFFHSTLAPGETAAERVSRLVRDDTVRRAARRLAEDGWHDDAGVLGALGTDAG